VADCVLVASHQAKTSWRVSLYVRRPRYTPWVADAIRELLVTEAALDKLGARGISAVEAEQVPRNRHVTVRDPRQGSERAGRRLLIGHTDGGRALTLVIEQTADPTTWLIVTGWGATEAERKILERR
jgi:hypothetical protein